MLAEQLTRRALKQLDEMQKSTFLGDSSAFALRRATTRDSLAWALFKQKKFADAAREQKNALVEARSAIDAGASDPNGETLQELTSHWKQIENATKTASQKTAP